MHRILVSAMLVSCSAFQLPQALPRPGGAASATPATTLKALPRPLIAMQMPQAAVQLLTYIGRAPEEISFQLVMDAVDELYDVYEVDFSVGDVVSAPGQNMGSAKVFSFAIISKLDVETTLQLFGDYYRKDVLENPGGTDHANIRSFMQYGWDGVNFPNGLAIEAKQK